MRYRILSRAALFRFLLHLLPAEAAIPFLVSRCIHDPLIYASEAAMLEQGFLRWEGCGMGVPGGRNLIRASVDCPAAVAYPPANVLPRHDERIASHGHTPQVLLAGVLWESVRLGLVPWEKVLLVQAPQALVVP